MAEKCVSIFLGSRTDVLVAVQRRDAGRAKHEIFIKKREKETALKSSFSPLALQKKLIVQAPSPEGTILQIVSIGRDQLHYTRFHMSVDKHHVHRTVGTMTNPISSIGFGPDVAAGQSGRTTIAGTGVSAFSVRHGHLFGRHENTPNVHRAISDDVILFVITDPGVYHVVRHETEKIVRLIPGQILLRGTAENIMRTTQFRIALRHPVQFVCQRFVRLQRIESILPATGSGIRSRTAVQKPVGFRKTPVIVVFNKSDLGEPPAELVARLDREKVPHVTLSAAEKTGFEALRQKIIELAPEDFLSASRML